jgi:hypothetical protein
LITAGAVLFTAGAVSAQTTPSRFAAGGTVGFGQTWDDEGSIGRGWLAGGYADVRLFGHTDAEFAVDVLRHDRNDRFQAQGHTTFASAALRQRFGGDRTYGYVLGGVAIGSHTGTAGFPELGLVNEYSGTHGGFLFGGGFTFTAGNNVEIGPVVRIALLGADSDSDPASAIMTGVRIGFRK